MGLSNAWNVATSSLATNAGLTSIVSRNISNAQNSTGYVSAKVANLVTGSNGASVIQSITDLTNATPVQLHAVEQLRQRRGPGPVRRRDAIAADGRRRHHDGGFHHRRDLALDAAAIAFDRAPDLFLLARATVPPRPR